MVLVVGVLGPASSLERIVQNKDKHLKITEHLSTVARILLKHRVRAIVCPDGGIPLLFGRIYKENRGKVMCLVVKNVREHEIVLNKIASEFGRSTRLRRCVPTGTKVFETSPCDSIVSTDNWFYQPPVMAFLADALLVLGLAPGVIAEVAYGLMFRRWVIIDLKMLKLITGRESPHSIYELRDMFLEKDLILLAESEKELDVILNKLSNVGQRARLM